MWESLLASSEFDVVRLKNKIGKCKEPFNLHVIAHAQRQGGKCYRESRRNRSKAESHLRIKIK